MSDVPLTQAQQAAIFAAPTGSTVIVNSDGSTTTAKPPSDTLTLIVNDQALVGWQSVRVSRGCEKVPSDFDIAFTDRYPGKPSIVVKPGDACQVKIGSDLVITGYVDRFMPSISAQSHTLRVSGRSKCEDLVDCSSVRPGMQIGGKTLLALAQELSTAYGRTPATPNGITVSSPPGTGSDKIIPQFNVTLGQTPYEIIEMMARYCAVLAYDGTDGNLILAQVGASKMASGFQQGVNVQSAQACFSMDQRFSIYHPSIMSTDCFSDYKTSAGIQLKDATDSGVPRFREMIVVSEQAQNGNFIAEVRAQWEAARRYGRSQAVNVTVDNWRDSAGTLWTPNAFVSIKIPAIQIDTPAWIIGHVTYSRTEGSGTTATLECMPQNAYVPEPSILQLYDWMVAQDMASGGAAGSGAGSTSTPTPFQTNLPPAAL